jgi:hypothetical protein
LLSKLLKALKASPRDASIVSWLAAHPDTDAALVAYALADESVDIDVFTAAAGVRHRGTVRPEPAVLIERIKRAFAED